MGVIKRVVTSALLAGASVMLFAGPASATITKSPSFAGYTATATTPFTSFSGSLTAPATVSCPASAQVDMNMAVTLGSASETAYFSTDFFCSNGSVQTGDAYAAICFGGSTCPQGYVGFKPGDVLHFKLAESASTGYTTLTVTNATEQQIASAAIHQLPSFTSVRAGTSFCCATGTSPNITPIPSFTAVKFSALKFGGNLLSALSPSESKMYDGTVLQVATSAISSTGGFTNSFKHV
jgi:hypothetical protein